MPRKLGDMTEAWPPTDPPLPDGGTAASNPVAPPLTPVESNDHTLTLPSIERPVATAPARRSAALPAAVLVGSLVLGGAAGVGGSFAYDAMRTKTPVREQAAPALPTNASAVEKVAAAVLPSVVQINTVSGNSGGTGSGVIISKDGLILTNNHVVGDAANGSTLTVNFHDGTSTKATVLGTDAVTDIGVIKAEGVSDLPVAKIGDSEGLRVGQEVVAVGSPYGLEATVTSGIVSALNRAVSIGSDEPSDPFEEESGAAARTTYPAIQTDTAINPGNSGGPLVDLAGRVIGINSSIHTAGSGGSIGLGFAIPIHAIMPVVDQLVAGEQATHARLGISVQGNTEGDQVASGAVIEDIEDGSGAMEAGLEVGDIITAIDGYLTPTPDSVVATVRSYRPGDSVDVTFTRDGVEKVVTVVLNSDSADEDS